MVQPLLPPPPTAKVEVKKVRTFLSLIQIKTSQNASFSILLLTFWVLNLLNCKRGAKYMATWLLRVLLRNLVVANQYRTLLQNCFFNRFTSCSNLTLGTSDRSRRDLKTESCIQTRKVIAAINWRRAPKRQVVNAEKDFILMKRYWSKRFLKSSWANEIPEKYKQIEMIF